MLLRSLQEKLCSTNTNFLILESPIPLDINVYRNAQSSSNPSGNIKNAENFFILNDTLPSPGKYNSQGQSVFIDSQNKLSRQWELLIENANSDSCYTNSQIADNKSKLLTSKQASALPNGSPWYHIEAIPTNWCEMLEESDVKLQKFNLEKSLLESLKFGFNTENNYLKRLLNSQLISNIHVDFIPIRLERRWFDFSLFRSKDWWVNGKVINDYSNGKEYFELSGELSLIPNIMFVSRNINLEIDSSFLSTTNLKEVISDIEFISIDGNKISTNNKLKVITQNNKQFISINYTYLLGYVVLKTPASPSK